MNDDDLARLLGDAFEARARSTVTDDRPVPPRRADAPARAADRPPGRRRAWLAPALAAAVVLALVTGVFALRADRSTHARPGVSRAGQAPGVPVTVRFAQTGGATYGVGEPVVATFDRTITDGRDFVAHTTVRVNGSAAGGAWYFLRTSGGGLQAHYRLRAYWPAHSTITVAADLRGRPAGTGLVFADSPALTLHTGAALVSSVDGRSHTMLVRVDGALARRIPVSVGAAQSPTYSGTKVVLARYRHISLSSSLPRSSPGGYANLHIDYAVRVTTSSPSSSTGEYLLALSATEWAQGRSNVSQGSVNMSTENARWFYEHSRPGDIVTYVNTSGPAPSLTNGLGDWDVSWATWQAGGVVPTH